MSQQALLAQVDNQQQRENRLLVVISGEATWCLAQATRIQQHKPAFLWFGDGSESGIPIDHAKRYLGQSVAGVIYNGFSGFNPNAVAALSGCVNAGGTLVMLLPAMQQWPSFDCPDYARLAVHGYTPTGVKRFLSRCAGLIEANTNSVLWQQHQPLVLPPLLPSIPREPVPQPYQSACQQAAVAAIAKVANGRRYRPLVLHAARGRGKSASLGLAARQLLNDGKTVALVAPHKQSVASVYERLASDQHLPFYAPDAFDQQMPPADVVLVDEAAAIPVPMLLRWQQHYPRLVYSSTSYGYEGHGQGFLKRFIPALAALRPQFKQLELQTPIRWQQPCALEQAVDEWFLLNAAEPEVKAPTSTVRCTEVSQDLLLANPVLFEQIYSVLLSAHYQTTPDDLRVLLDGANIRLFAAFDQHTVMAVAMIAEEGGLEPALHQPVFNGQRRVKGHVAPQFWASQSTTPQVLALRCWRVVRIATLYGAQRQHIGSTLLQAVVAQAKAAQQDYVASVFAFSAQVLPFWVANGFYSVAVNNKVDSVSACLTGVVVQPLKPPVAQRFVNDAGYFLQQLPLVLQQQSCVLNEEQVIAMLASLRELPSLTEQDSMALKSFARANRSLSACYVSLQRLLMMSATEHHLSQQPIYHALIAHVVLAKPVQTVCGRFGFTGQAAWLKAARVWVNQAIQGNM